MLHLDLILTLTGGLSAALILGYITHRLGLSPIVGYLLGGIAVGPSTPGFVANTELASELAEIGVILLMFGVGLHFHFKELFKVRYVAIPGAIGQSLVATLLGCLVAWFYGWGWQAGLVFGLAISVASTVVLLRVLVDHNDLHSPAGHIAVGWLVIEDLFTVLILVLLPVAFRPGAEASNMALEFGWAILKIGVLIASVFVVGGRVLPWLLTHVAATRSRELFTLAVLVVALGIAVAASRVFGVSMALGAFLAGMIVGRSDFSSRAASEALPMRDAFAVLFFVSVGMLFNPAFLLEAPVMVGLTLAIILLGKPLAALAIVLILGYPLRVGLSVGMALAQIGEFSFILAGLGRELEILPEEASHAIIAAAIVSISVNPLLYRLVDFFEEKAKRTPRLWSWLNGLSRRSDKVAAKVSPSRDPSLGNEAIVVGFGPVGRTLVTLLRENGVDPTIIELNLETVRRLQAQGHHAVYGDASHQETIHEAGAKRAVVFILSTSGMHGTEEAIRLVREANPAIRVFARAAHLYEIPSLRRAGADVVFSGEGEVALSMTEFLLRQLGATAEQIEREKERVRKDLFERSASSENLLPSMGTNPEATPSQSEKVEATSETTPP